MSSRDSGQWRHLSKLRQNLNECPTFSRPESTYWNKVTVMLFFHKRWWLKKKNSRTAAPFWPQRDLIVVGSRVDAPGQRSIERNLIPRFFFFRARIIHVNVQCLPSGKKERYIGVLLLPRTRNILVPKTEFITPKNYGFFSQRTSIWRYKM